MCVPLPATKAVALASGAWASLLFQSGHDALQHIEVTTDDSDGNDGSEPLYMRTADTQNVAVTIHCDLFPWSAHSCASSDSDGATMQIPEVLRSAPNSDHHASIDDRVRGGEVDFWVFPTGAPPTDAHVGGAGFCSYAGDGTNCSGATATNIATSLGGIDPVVVRGAESDAHGALPYAISVSALCADPSWVFPATYSDGSNTDGSSACANHTGTGQRPPEGTRGFIDRSDADIDATSNAPYVKVILRTMDREHLGFTITDTNWSGAPGLAPEYRTSSPTAWGFALAEAGLGSSGTEQLPITTNGIDLSTDVKFCSNGTC